MELDNVTEFTVSELSNALRRTLEDAYGYVRVRGEISGLQAGGLGPSLFRAQGRRRPASTRSAGGSTAQRLTFKPEDGLEVVGERADHHLSRAARSYQLIVDRLAPAGVGALMALLEERRQKLAAEGLFAAERKRPCPSCPR